jgi:hypothetical protein
MSLAMSSYLNQQVLVLNRLWQAVNICTARRALTLLFQGHAQVVFGVPDGSFRTFDFCEWHDFAAGTTQRVSIPSPLRFVPRVIMLLIFDRLPKKKLVHSAQYF